MRHSRLVPPSHRAISHLSPPTRLDLKRKELLKEKEALLKESKAKLATMESVKSHIDTLMKVRPFLLPLLAMSRVLQY